jgi:hypothetical protein
MIGVLSRGVSISVLIGRPDDASDSDSGSGGDGGGRDGGGSGEGDSDDDNTVDRNRSNSASSKEGGRYRAVSAGTSQLVKDHFTQEQKQAYSTLTGLQGGGSDKEDTLGHHRSFFRLLVAYVFVGMLLPLPPLLLFKYSNQAVGEAFTYKAGLTAVSQLALLIVYTLWLARVILREHRRMDSLKVLHNSTWCMLAQCLIAVMYIGLTLMYKQVQVPTLTPYYSAIPDVVLQPPAWGQCSNMEPKRDLELYKFCGNVGSGR